MVSSGNILRRQKTLQRVCPKKENGAAADYSGRACVSIRYKPKVNPTEKSVVLCEPPYTEWCVRWCEGTVDKLIIYLLIGFKKINSTF